MLPRGQSYGRSFTTGQVRSIAQVPWGRLGQGCGGCRSEHPLPCLSLTHRSPQINDELNHQFEAVCESVFGEVESQAVEALDLPGCFRMRSHSYLRAIQAGCSQDDDCLSLFSMSAPPGPPITSSILKPSTCESQGVVRVWLRDGPPHLPACSPGHLPRAAAALLLSLDPYSARHRV